MFLGCHTFSISFPQGDNPCNTVSGFTLRNYVYFSPFFFTVLFLVFPMSDVSLSLQVPCTVNLEEGVQYQKITWYKVGLIISIVSYKIQ